MLAGRGFRAPLCGPPGAGSEHLVGPAPLASPETLQPLLQRSLELLELIDARGRAR